MNIRTAPFAVLSLVAIAVAALADNEVIGTIQMSLDEDERTWYVLDPGEGMLPTALWQAMGPNRGALSIGAYERPDMEFMRDETTGWAVPAGDAAALLFSIGFPVDADEQNYSFPLQSPDDMATILLLTDWSEPLNGIDISRGPGRIELTDIDIATDGPSSFTGTFSGVLRNDAGDMMTVENGSINVERVPFFQGLPE